MRKIGQRLFDHFGHAAHQGFDGVAGLAGSGQNGAVAVGFHVEAENGGLPIEFRLQFCDMGLEFRALGL
ncbi:MAG: hypothetical protein ABSG62_09650 [Terracidiphilus sp.]